jgi:hypothetical protein
MAKKKRSKKERDNEMRREAEELPSVRLLRELYERGMAELEERRRIDPNYR